MSSLSDRLRQQVLIFDGAMGTEIYKRHFFVNTSFESLCLTAPEVIASIHTSYQEAGAEVLTTNSYGANANILSKFGLADRMGEINRAAVKLARAAGKAETMVAGSVGPVGEIPFGKDVSDAEKLKIVTDHARALMEGGADFLLFETLTSVEDVTRAVAAAQACGAFPYVISLALNVECESARGESLEQLLRPIAALVYLPTALGLNCGEGAESTLSALERLKPLADYPLIVRPNAGVPRQVDGRTLYMTSPEYLTTYAMRYVGLGARAIGGCCGTGPDHIRDMARSVRPLASAEYSGRITLSPEAGREYLKEALPTAEKSALGAKLAAGAWVTTIELVPPRGYELGDLVQKAVKCREAGIDAVNIPDGPRASSRISPIVAAQAVQDRAGIEAILHFCCRDRNLIAMQADLLGCAAMNIRNLLFVTGDPPKLGDYPFASGVFDVDSIGMARIQARLNRGVDLGGKPVDPATRALIGVGADPNAIDMKRELRRIREKVEAGAEFVITQPVFAADPLLKFLDAIQDLAVPVVAGIWPLASYRNAEFMKNEVPGVVVPDGVMARMAAAKSKDDQRLEGIRIARESISAIRSRIAGIQVSAPFGNVATAIAVAVD